MDEVFRGMDCVNVEYVIALRDATHRWWQLPHVLIPTIRRPASHRLPRENAGTMEAGHPAIWKVSGQRVVFDSSKTPPHAFVRAEMPSIRPKMIHHHLRQVLKSIAHCKTIRTGP